MIIVAGLTRCGLTVTMQMLHAGGYPCAGEYPAFEPYGVGEIPWKECQGKAVKFVDPQLQFPKKLKGKKVILLSRDTVEQAKSQVKFLRAFFPIISPAPGKSLIRSINRDQSIIGLWAKKNHKVLPLRFEEIISTPQEVAQRLADFVGGNLDANKMAEVVVPRSTDCYLGMLELEERFYQ